MKLPSSRNHTICYRSLFVISRTMVVWFQFFNGHRVRTGINPNPALYQPTNPFKGPFKGALDHLAVSNSIIRGRALIMRTPKQGPPTYGNSHLTQVPGQVHLPIVEAALAQCGEVLELLSEDLRDEEAGQRPAGDGPSKEIYIRIHRAP